MRLIPSSAQLKRFLFVPMIGLSSLGFAGEIPDSVRQAFRTGDYAAAHETLLRLEKEGNDEALYELGRLHQRGLGVDLDLALAHDYFERAAESGHLQATYLVGTNLATGKGIPMDVAAALVWLERAEAGGHPLAAAKYLTLMETAPASDNPAESIIFALTVCDIEKAAGLVETAVDGVLDEAIRAAAGCDDGSILQRLIDHGASIRAVDSAGNTALHIATAGGFTRGVELLLRAGSDPNSKNNEAWTSAMLAERGQRAEMMALFQLKKEPRKMGVAMTEKAAEMEAHKGWSTLSIAAWRGDLEMTRELLEQGVDVNGADITAVSALGRAVSRGHSEVALLLLRRGANAANSGLLTMAVETDQFELIAPLIRGGADILEVNSAGHSTLRLAVSAGNSRMVRTLLENGAPADGSQEKLTPMMLAARQGQLEILDDLLKAEAKLILSDSDGCTALCWGLRSGHADSARALLGAGAHDTETASGETTLMLAAGLGCLDCVQALADRGADVNARTDSGSTTLLHAAVGGHGEVVQYLLDQNVLASVRDARGDTPLIVAVRARHTDVAGMLLENGANAYARNDRFESAASLAEDRADEKILDLIETHRGLFDLFADDPS